MPNGFDRRRLFGVSPRAMKISKISPIREIYPLFPNRAFRDDISR